LASGPTNAKVQWYQTVGHGETSSTLSPLAVPDGGGEGASHNNLMPTMYLNYIICYAGIYPNRN